MDISVLIPVYNVEKYVIRCLDSIAAQTKTENVECIIVDDCGTDNSMQLVLNFIENYVGDIKFKVLHHSRNRGLAATRNTALECAEGKYVVMIDSDDYCEHNMLEEYYNAAVMSGADIIVSDFWYTYADHEKYTKQEISQDKTTLVRNLLTHKLFTVNWNRCVKRSLYIDNEITYLEGIDYGEDMKVCFPLYFAAKKIEYINKAFVHYVQYNDNAYNNEIKRKSLEDYIVVINSVSEILQSSGIYDQCAEVIRGKQLSVKNLLLMHSRGDLQKRWNLLYPEAIFALKTAQISTSWKVGLLFAHYGFLPIYNLIRKLDMIRHRRNVVIYE